MCNFYYIFLVLILVLFICSILDEILNNRKFIKKLQPGTILQKTYNINEFDITTLKITIVDVGKYYAKIKYSDNSISIIPVTTLIEDDWKIIN